MQLEMFANLNSHALMHASAEYWYSFCSLRHEMLATLAQSHNIRFHFLFYSINDQTVTSSILVPRQSVGHILDLYNLDCLLFFLMVFYSSSWDYKSRAKSLGSYRLNKSILWLAIRIRSKVDA